MIFKGYDYTHNVYEVAEVLKEEYRDFTHHNKKHPLDELEHRYAKPQQR